MYMYIHVSRSAVQWVLNYQTSCVPVHCQPQQTTCTHASTGLTVRHYTKLTLPIKVHGGTDVQWVTLLQPRHYGSDGYRRDCPLNNSPTMDFDGQCRNSLTVYH